MNIISKISRIVPILFLAVVFQACSSDDDNTPAPAEPSVVDLALATPNLGKLVLALQAADGDLVNVLSGPGPFTVLAPTDAAFDAFLAANNFATLADVPTDVLSNILLNHVISAEVTSAGLIAAGSGYTNTNAKNIDGDNLSLYYDTSNGVTFNGVATVSTPDVEGSNGVVHIVDAVIGLPTVVTFATSNPALSNLEAALVLADSQNPSPNLIGTLSGTGPFTVFAPTDTAFANLLLELDPTGNTALGDLPPALVTSVLTFHVVNGNVRSTDLMTGTVTTLGGDVELDAATLTITDPNGRTSNIIVELVDIQAYNGVVHAIDTVILPQL
jgi:uncharacterized surface protein with fasciclin (FAS1) repeats